MTSNIYDITGVDRHGTHEAGHRNVVRVHGLVRDYREGILNAGDLLRVLFAERGYTTSLILQRHRSINEEFLRDIITVEADAAMSHDDAGMPIRVKTGGSCSVDLFGNCDPCSTYC